MILDYAKNLSEIEYAYIMLDFTRKRQESDNLVWTKCRSLSKMNLNDVMEIQIA